MPQDAGGADPVRHEIKRAAPGKRFAPEALVRALQERAVRVRIPSPGVLLEIGGHIDEI